MVLKKLKIDMDERKLNKFSQRWKITTHLVAQFPISAYRLPLPFPTKLLLASFAEGLELLLLSEAINFEDLALSDLGDKTLDLNVARAGVSSYKGEVQSACNCRGKVPVPFQLLRLFRKDLPWDVGVPQKLLLVVIFLMKAPGEGWWGFWGVIATKAGWPDDMFSFEKFFYSMLLTLYIIFICSHFNTAL